MVEGTQSARPCQVAVRLSSYLDSVDPAALTLPTLLSSSPIRLSFPRLTRPPAPCHPSRLLYLSRDGSAGEVESTINPHGMASRRRRSRSRTGSARRETSHSHGNATKLTRSASAVAEEKANAAGTLGTIETQEEGAVAWKVGDADATKV